MLKLEKCVGKFFNFVKTPTFLKCDFARFHKNINHKNKIYNKIYKFKMQVVTIAV